MRRRRSTSITSPCCAGAMLGSLSFFPLPQRWYHDAIKVSQKSVTINYISDLSGRATVQSVERNIEKEVVNPTRSHRSTRFFPRSHPQNDPREEIGISHCRMLVVLRFFPRSHSQTGTLMKIQHPVSASCSLQPCSSVPVCMSARFGASQDKLSAM